MQTPSQVSIQASQGLKPRARNVHLLDERLDDFLVRAVVAFNVLVQLLAYRLIFNVHFFVVFPPRVRVHPVLNDARLVAGRHVNELLDVRVVFVLDPLVRLHVHGLALQVRAVDRAQVHVHALQVVHDDGAHALHNPLRLRVLQVLQRDFQGFYEIAQLDRVLALVVQKHVQVELRVVRGNDVAVANFGRHLLNGLNELLVLLRHLPQHILVIHHHFVALGHNIVALVIHRVPIVQQHLHHGLQIHQLFVLVSNVPRLFGNGRNLFFHNGHRHGCGCRCGCRCGCVGCIRCIGHGCLARLLVIVERRPQLKCFATCA